MDNTCVWASVVNFEAAFIGAMPALFDELKGQRGTLEAAEKKEEEELAAIWAEASPILAARTAEDAACDSPTEPDPYACHQKVETKYEPLLAPFNARQSASEAKVNGTRDAVRDARKAAFAHLQAIRDQAAAVMAINMPISCTEHPVRTSISPVPPFGMPSEIRPDIVYLAQHGGPDYIAQAKAFHDQWDLPTLDVVSLEQIIEDIPKRAAKKSFSRIRIVTHATTEDLFLLVFTDGKVFFQRKFIDALADSDISLLRAILFFEDVDLLSRQGQWEASLNRQRAQVALAARELLGKAGVFPTGLGQEDEELVRVYLFSIALSASIASGKSLTEYTGKASSYAFALATLIGLLRREFSVSAKALQGMEQQLRGLVKAGKLTLNFELKALGRVPKAYSQNHSTESRACAKAIQAGLRKKIEAARKALRSLEEPVWVDIRGCNAGRSAAQAIDPLARLLDIPPTRVTAPTVNQYFTPVLTMKRSYECEIGKLMKTAGKSIIKRSVRRWASLFNIDDIAFNWQSYPALIPWHGLTDTEKLMIVLKLGNLLPVFATKADFAAEGASQEVLDQWPGNSIAVQVILGFEDCVKQDVLHARQIWLRTMWADASKRLVSTLARDWDKDRATIYCPVLAGGRNGIAIHGDPDYQRLIRTG